MAQQIKTKERVSKYGEVFTAKREVNAMLDLVSKESFSIDSTFMEPACGNGNFLVEILRRKMISVFQLASDNDADGEYLATRAVSTIYGVDILMDNVLETRERLYKNFFAAYINHYRHKPTQICMDSIRFILSQNIQCGNTLTCQTEAGSPLHITQWLFDHNNGLTINIYDYKTMVDTGCECAPIHSLPCIHYLFLPAIIRQK